MNRQILFILEVLVVLEKIELLVTLTEFLFKGDSSFSSFF